MGAYSLNEGPCLLYERKVDYDTLLVDLLSLMSNSEKSYVIPGKDSGATTICFFDCWSLCSVDEVLLLEDQASDPLSCGTIRL